jgi:hypothetical protein
MTLNPKEEGIAPAPSNFGARTFWLVGRSVVPWTIVMAGISNAVLHFFPNAAGIVFYPFAFGGAVGYLTGKKARASNVRNKPPYTILGATFGLVALYISWVTFLWLLTGEPWFSPGSICDAMRQLAAAGLYFEGFWFPQAHWTDQGTMVWIYWSIEALAIVGGSTLISATLTEY